MQERRSNLLQYLELISSLASAPSGPIDDTLGRNVRAGTLLASAAPLAPRTLLESTPTVLGMRAVRVDPELPGLLRADPGVRAVKLVLGRPWG